MTYQEAENYLLTLGNIRSTEGKSDQHQSVQNLLRVQFLLDILGNPERQIPHYIHVTGTSGKGSVCRFLHSILSTSGRKTGLNISPHPTHIRERWQVGGNCMSKSEFIEIISQLKPALQTYFKTSPYPLLSFVDLTTVIGLIFFAQKKVEWAVVEVVCGGLYDSTNVLPSKDVAVITNIGIDHVGLLGDTKEKIVKNKAGIINGPTQVYTMEKSNTLVNIIKDTCKKKKAIFHPYQATYSLLKNDTEGIAFTYKEKTYSLSTLGTHQVQNAILCIDIAHDLKISQTAIETGLSSTLQPLRMEIMSKNPLIILDAAHNEDKIKSSVAAIQNFPQKNIHLLIEFSADKDIKKFIKILSVLKPKTIACTRNTVNLFRKAANPRTLKELFQKALPQTKIEIFLEPEQALKWSQSQLDTNDALLITGSIFLSGQLREFFQES